jgi:hypothetical protein
MDEFDRRRGPFDVEQHDADARSRQAEGHTWEVIGATYDGPKQIG